MRSIVAAGALTFATLAGGTVSAEEKEVLFKADFETGGLKGWYMTDPTAWKLTEANSGKALELAKQSKYKTKFRSPYNYALIEDLNADSFQMDIKVKSTAKRGDYPHRDLCLFFGYQDPEHYYYAHLGRDAVKGDGTPDPNAHSIFAVDGADRLSIIKERTKGTPWTNGWHQVRLIRDIASGDIKIYFDDMEKPVLSATDIRFKTGKIGVGSFDDEGVFDDIVITKLH